MSKKIYFQYTPPAKIAWDELPVSEKELQEIRNMLKKYIRENSSVAKSSDGTCLQSDIKVLQQIEADICLAEMMKQHHSIIYKV